MDNQLAYQEVRERLRDRTWRLNNLYYIKDERGQKIKFRMNWAQQALYSTLWYFNIILKARQLGFTTFILIYFLDACLFNSNHSAGVIAHTREDAEDLFDNKVKFAYDELPAWLKDEIKAEQDTARRLKFENGSSITVGTSLRSGTYQKLLISEYGKISARYPDKALEIKTGALNTVHAGQQIFVESTAEGRQGEFFELVKLARKLLAEARKLTTLDPKFFFFPWFKHPGYELNESEAATTSVNAQMAEYFAQLQNKHGITLTPGQKAWYIKKEAVQQDLMKREFPSTPDEAFEASLEGCYYTKQMAMVRKNGQIGKFPWEASKQVHTFWDIGLNDEMAIWFFQHIGHEYRFIDYHESSGEGWQFYANLLKSKGYVYGTHYWPHDGNKRVQGATVQTSKQIAMELGIRPIEVVGRTNDVVADINNYCRTVLPRCSFDETNCAIGIDCLDSYRKEWDEKLGVWKESPRHDRASNCADAFRTFAVGYKGRQAEFIDMNERPQIADGDYDMMNY